MRMQAHARGVVQEERPSNCTSGSLGSLHLVSTPLTLWFKHDFLVVRIDKFWNIPFPAAAGSVLALVGAKHAARDVHLLVDTKSVEQCPQTPVILGLVFSTWCMVMVAAIFCVVLFAIRPHVRFRVVAHGSVRVEGAPAGRGAVFAVDNTAARHLVTRFHAHGYIGVPSALLRVRLTQAAGEVKVACRLDASAFTEANV